MTNQLVLLFFHQTIDIHQNIHTVVEKNESASKPNMLKCSEKLMVADRDVEAEGSGFLMS